MGIFINLMIIPQRISREKWASVYKETLRLVEAYDFMDKIEGRRNGLQYFYARKTEDRANLFGKGCHGWHSVGDMRTGCNTEDYTLYADINAYLPEAQTEDNGADILLCGLRHMADIDKPNTCINIWGNQSRGEDSHIYLLAIACLIADRFPKAAMVSGDISVGQCRRAVKWANEYLDEAIDLPCTGRMDKLLERLKNSAVPGEKLLEAFYALTDEAKNAGMGEFLKKEFSSRELTQYYRKRFLAFKADQRGFVSTMKEYLEMGYDFEELCRIAVGDPDGMRMEPEAFLRQVIETKLYIKEKEIRDFTKTPRENADCEEVDKNKGIVARLMGLLCGAGNKNAAAFYPLDKIKADCKNVFGNQCDVEAVIDRLIAEEEKSNKDSIQSIFYDDADSILRQELLRAEKECREDEKYEVSAYSDIIDFTPGCSIRPQLEADLIKNFKAIYRFAEKEFEEFKILNREQREKYFICNNHHVLLKEEVWNRIFDKVMDDKYIIRIYGLFGVNCSKQDGYRFCKNLFSNLQAIDYYWDKAMKSRR